MSDSRPLPRPASYDKKVGLVLQGGGALGSYQAGVYEALASSPYLPDWVAGISIGAINAALIAGNPPENRVAQLRRFWEGIDRSDRVVAYRAHRAGCRLATIGRRNCRDHVWPARFFRSAPAP